MRDAPQADPAVPSEPSTSDEVSSGLGPGGDLAGARPLDPLALVLARARVAGALFGQAGGLGRLRVLDRLGAGGMGVVYSAYDPELDRGVAVKAVRVERGRDAALSEAKALARLSHPNVVPIYDVGVDGDVVYLVMELVRGETLRRWAAGRGAGDILRAYRQAGEALAAAHAAGLVHRDFKPDNAIVGADGRVRVVDFGLACEAEVGAPLPVAGTPRYMAPEQADGAVSPAADQYSFCVALDEALSAASTAVPGWLAAVIARGRSAEPAARFASMAALLQALSRDLVRRRRRRWQIAAMAGAIVAVAVVAFAAGSSGPSDSERCEAAGKLDAAWPTDAQASALARIAGLGAYGRRLAPELARTLGDHAARWRVVRRDACVAHRDRAASDALFDRQIACLERGRAALAEVAAVTARTDATTLPALAYAVRAIPDPAACADRATLLAQVEPPPPALAEPVEQLRDELARARVQLAAGRANEAGAIAARCVASARVLGYRPVLAEALLVEGHTMMMGPRAAAVPVLVEATDTALVAGMDDVAVEAWARRAWAQGTDAAADRPGALAGLDLVQAIAARTPSARFARALLANNLGSVALADEHRDQARAAFERAAEEARGVTGPEAVELLVIRTNLAVITDDPERRDALLADAVAATSALLGPDHPTTLEHALTRGTMRISTAAAAEFLAPVCVRYEIHGDLADRCWAELGYLESELGDDARAADTMAHAVRAGSHGPPELPYLALWHHRAAEAIDGFRARLAALPDAAGAPWWQRLTRAKLQLGLGRALRSAGQLAEARRALAASVVALAEIVHDHPAAPVERRLARARAELAMTLAALGAPRGEVAPLAEAAAAWLRRAGGRSGELSALEALAAVP